MESIQGFLLINIYAFLVIAAMGIIFISKKRLKQVEDELYKYFLLDNIFVSGSGLLLGLLVSFNFNYQEFAVIIVNKIYLISLLLWITMLTFYIFYVSFKEKINTKKMILSLTRIILILTLLIFLLPIEININPVNKAATSTGLGVILTYALVAIGFIIQIFCLIVNYKNIKNKKYIPLYLLILIGSIVLIIQIINPNLNYIINPSLIFISFIMFFTIENPDTKMLDEVHRAKEITDSANEEKAMFLYNMTNEIRNITKDIDDSAENILSETDNKNINVENINDNARDIKVSTAKFTSMTNEILDISSIDSANIKIYNDKYNIKLILKELVQIYKNSAEKKDLDFRTNIASDLPEYLYGDAVNVKVSLNTILDNAIKYTERGFIEFNVNAIMKNDIARLIISVEDSGIGMKAEDLNKIFNKREEDKENTNLKSNLYNAKKLVTLMGGTIIPSSIYGKGTIIKVVLDQKIGEIETELNKYESVYDKKKILIVDDNPSSIKMITKLLKDSNMIIDTANSGKECLDKIRDKEKYDLILLDENMTPLNGLTVMRKLREIRNFNINVILLTKNNDYEYNEEYLRYGFKDYLIKPIDKDKLLKKISKYSK